MRETKQQPYYEDDGRICRTDRGVGVAEGDRCREASAAMRESEKAAAYTVAINLLVDQAVTAAKPKSPGAYAATVRADLSERHRDAAREAFRKYGDLSGEHLAILLTADDARATGGDVRPMPLEPWTPPEPEPTAGPVTPRETARERLAAIRATLPPSRRHRTTTPPLRNQSGPSFRDRAQAREKQNREQAKP
jgi:hypothetical protein